MAKKIWTAAELDEMAPTERRRVLDASIVWDLDDAPQHLVDRARAKVMRRIADSEGKQAG